MHLAVTIDKILRSRARSFELAIRFATSEDLVVLFGPSGAGKSATMQCIAGLLRPDTGSIRFGAETLFDSTAGIDVPARRRNIGYVFQDYALFPHRTVAQNVAAALAPLIGHRLSGQHRDRVEALLDAFELSPIQRSYPSQISGGQRQRTALARALAGEPKFLLLDEPFNALDTGLRAKMRHEVLQVWERFRVPIVLITHDEADAETFGREIIAIDNGQVIAHPSRGNAGGGLASSQAAIVTG